MALDFYNVNDKKLLNRLFSLEGAHLEVLLPTLVEYKRRTGLSIDPYGTTRIHHAHVEIILELINKALSDFKNSNDTPVLLQLLNGFKQSTEGLLAIGD